MVFVGTQEVLMWGSRLGVYCQTVCPLESASRLRYPLSTFVTVCIPPYFGESRLVGVLNTVLKGQSAGAIVMFDFTGDSA